MDIWFDYQWDVNPPTVPDVFSVELDYLSNGGLVTTTLLNQDSTVGLFNAYTMFHGQLSLTDLVASDSIGTLRYQLVENNASNGTRIQLDNVIVEVANVPEPATLTLFGLGILGFGYVRRKTR